jgi:hypothetical protein
MREVYRDIVYGLTLLIGATNAYFAVRGPRAADPPAVQAVANHPIGGLIVVAILFLIAGVLNAAPLLNRLIRSAGVKAADPPPPPPPPEKTWGDIMAEDDAKNIRKRVCELNQRKEFHFRSGSDPYIDIITELWNGSVFQLVSYGEISGHVTYSGKQLAGEPRVIVSVEPPLLSLHHGDSVTLTVRQYLSAQVADMMEANRNRGIAIDFESVFVSFKILPLDHRTKMDRFTWQGPRFAIEDATRA